MERRGNIGQSLLGLQSLDRERLVRLLQSAQAHQLHMTESKSRDVLSDMAIAILSYEGPTALVTAFVRAASILGVTACVETAPPVGERLRHSLERMEAQGVAAIVLCHEASGSSLYAQNVVTIPVWNGRDGSHEEPLRALAILLALAEQRQIDWAQETPLAGITVCVVGDVLHSGLARSILAVVRELGGTVRLAGPAPLVPEVFSALGAEVCHDIAVGLADVDLVVGTDLEIQRLVEEGGIASSADYGQYFTVTPERLRQAAENVYVCQQTPISTVVVSHAVQGQEYYFQRQVDHWLVAVAMALMMEGGLCDAVVD